MNNLPLVSQKSNQKLTVGRGIQTSNQQLTAGRGIHKSDEQLTVGRQKSNEQLTVGRARRRGCGRRHLPSPRPGPRPLSLKVNTLVKSTNLLSQQACYVNKLESESQHVCQKSTTSPKLLWVTSLWVAHFPKSLQSC